MGHTYSGDFEECWQEYPATIGQSKFKAFGYWQRLKKQGVLPDKRVILDAINNQKKERSFAKSQNRFVPAWKHFSTWINQHCWEIECELPKPAEIQKPKGGNRIHDYRRAFNILINYPEKFDAFCQALRFSPVDIERVKNKASGQYDVRRLAGGIG